MPSAKNTQHISNIDCPGGGQVWVDGTTMYVAHMQAPSGTTIFDISDPRKPKTLAKIEMPDGWHSHKVRVSNGIMIVNHEMVGKQEGKDFVGGLAVYDVKNPAAPRQIGKWETRGGGVHRYDFDGRYAYVSSSKEGFVGNIPIILDLKDPTKPVEVGHWWIPGQWKAGGEEYPWGDFVEPRCHHPLRVGDRLNVSYWHHGMYILDISDITKPKMISGHRRSPAFPHPTHTCLQIPGTHKGRKIMVVADEDVAELRPSSPSFAWIYDITDERCPVPISTINVEGPKSLVVIEGPLKGTIIPFAWFAQGLRIFDVADPFAPKEVGYFVPDAPVGAKRPSANDVTMDDRGLIYLIDRIRGVDVIEAKL